MVILRMNNSICEGRGRIFISIEFAIRSIDIPEDRFRYSSNSLVIIRLIVSTSPHAGMALACSVVKVRLDVCILSDNYLTMSIYCLLATSESEECKMSDSISRC